MRFYSIINDLAKTEEGVIVISSEMPELLGICDRIYVMNKGQIRRRDAGGRQRTAKEKINSLDPCEAVQGWRSMGSTETIITGAPAARSRRRRMRDLLEK